MWGYIYFLRDTNNFVVECISIILIICVYTLTLCNDLPVVHVWGCIDESERERETGGYI